MDGIVSHIILLFIFKHFNYIIIDSHSNQMHHQKDNKNEPENNKPKVMITAAPIFFNKMPNYCYNKAYKKKNKPFIEREGDWVCKNCKNLNFAFRLECNRCKLPKDSDTKSNNVDINLENKKNQINNCLNNSMNQNNYNFCHNNNKPNDQ